MAPETVTVGDTEVEIRETDDGFEAVEVEDDDFESHVRDVLEEAKSFDVPSTFTDVAYNDRGATDLDIGSCQSRPTIGRKAMRAITEDERIGVQYVTAEDRKTDEDEDQGIRVGLYDRDAE